MEKYFQSDFLRVRIPKNKLVIQKLTRLIIVDISKMFVSVLPIFLIRFLSEFMENFLRVII